VSIENPSNYKGYREYGANFFINGELDLACGSFLSGFFITEIADTGIVVGPYPLYKQDVDQIADAGVQAVVNL
jgi:hypothetical protein